MAFSFNELLADIYKIMICGGIPYYSYQLWFINSLIRCIVIATICYNVFSDKKLRRFVFGFLLIVFFVKSDVYFSFFSGMFAAEIFENKYVRYFYKSKYGVSMCLLCIVIFPFTFNEHNLSINNANVLSICFAVLILGMVNIENYYGFKVDKNVKDVIDFLDKNTFSFYVLHVLIQKTFSNNVFIWMCKYISNERIVILLVWIITTAFLWGIASLFTKYVLNNITVLIQK